MRKCIDKIKSYLNKSPKLKQYLWFIGLWLFGLTSVFVLTLPLKLLMRNLA